MGFDKNQLLIQALQDKPEEVARIANIEKEAAHMAERAIDQLDSVTVEAWDALSQEDRNDTTIHEFSARNIEKVLGDDNDLFLYMKAALMTEYIMKKRLEKLRDRYNRPFTSSKKRDRAQLVEEMLINSAVTFVMRQIKQHMIEHQPEA